jgi:hypothetical protein
MLGEVTRPDCGAKHEPEQPVCDRALSPAAQRLMK